MPGSGERIAHVVQAIERGGQIVAGAGETGRGSDLEADPVRDAGVGGPLAGDLDRLVVIVRAGEPGVQVLLGQQDRGRAEPAADVGYPGAGPELVLHIVKRRDPGRDQVGDVAGARRSETNRPRNSCSLSVSTAMMSLLVLDMWRLSGREFLFRG
jgi:hypothetical protein